MHYFIAIKKIKYKEGINLTNGKKQMTNYNISYNLNVKTINNYFNFYYLNFRHLKFISGALRVKYLLMH
jgi:hypothetical protein